MHPLDTLGADDLARLAGEVGNPEPGSIRAAGRRSGSLPVPSHLLLDFGLGAADLDSVANTTTCWSPVETMIDTGPVGARGGFQL